MVSDVLLGVLYGAVGSLFTAGATYFKNSAKKKEDFDIKKFTITVLVAALAGAVSTFGIDPNILITGTFATSVGLVVENLIKGISRRR